MSNLDNLESNRPEFERIAEKYLSRKLQIRAELDNIIKSDVWLQTPLQGSAPAQTYSKVSELCSNLKSTTMKVGLEPQCHYA
tara:strand:- start:3683 stop:3928 length:246 start_codon:yes stop_codon:yes gene_type:complete